VNGKNLNFNGHDTTPVIIDTGTTLIYGDTNTVKDFYDQIPDSKPLQGQNLGYFSCEHLFSESSVIIICSTVQIPATPPII